MKKYIYVKSENQTNLKYKTKIIQNMLNLQLKKWYVRSKSQTNMI